MNNFWFDLFVFFTLTFLVLMLLLVVFTRKDIEYEDNPSEKLQDLPKYSRIRKEQPIIDKLNYLEQRLNVVKTNISSGISLIDCEKELQKCHSLGKVIEDMAKAQQIDMQNLFFEKVRINEMLIDIEYLINKKQNVWWRRVLHKIKELFNVVKVKLLPPGKKEDGK